MLNVQRITFLIPRYTPLIVVYSLIFFIKYFIKTKENEVYQVTIGEQYIFIHRALLRTLYLGKISYLNHCNSKTYAVMLKADVENVKSQTEERILSPTMLKTTSKCPGCCVNGKRLILWFQLNQSCMLPIGIYIPRDLLCRMGFSNRFFSSYQILCNN